MDHGNQALDNGLRWFWEAVQWIFDIFEIRVRVRYIVGFWYDQIVIFNQEVVDEVVRFDNGCRRLGSAFEEETNERTERVSDVGNAYNPLKKIPMSWWTVIWLSGCLGVLDCGEGWSSRDVPLSDFCFPSAEGILGLGESGTIELLVGEFGSDIRWSRS